MAPHRVRFGMLSLLCALVLGAGQALGAAQEVLLDAASAAQGWRVNLGREFPGAQGELAAGRAPDGRPALQVQFDFRKGGKYGGAEKAFLIDPSERISFSVWLQGAASGMVRLRDATHQEHAASFHAKPGAWRQVSLPITPQTFRGHWSGANDGKFHFPIRHIVIAAYPWGPRHGRMFIRDITILTASQRLRWKFSVSTPKPGNILFGDEGAMPIKLAVRNCTSREQATELSYRIADYDGGTLASQAMPLKLAKWEAHALDIAFDPPGLGYYVLDASVRAGGKEAAHAQAGLAVIERPRNFGRDDAASFFGIHSSAPDAAARIGVKWDRVNRSWWWVESIRGRFYWPDENVDAARRNGIQIMLTIHYQPPGWLKKLVGPKNVWPPNDAALQHWARFVRACVEHYRGRVAAFEIQNEPDLTCWRHPDLTFEQGVAAYERVVRTACSIIRKLAPGAPIAGVDVSGGDYRNGLRYSRAVMERVGSLLNIYTGHPYASPRYFGVGRRPLFPYQNRLLEKLEASKRMIREFGGRQRVWVGEKGWGLDIREPLLGPHSKAYARCAARALITGRAVSGVERWFWFLQQGCNEHGYEYGLWRGAPAQPLPAAAAYATAARFLYHVQPRRALRVGPPLRGFAFACPELKRGVAALWSVAQDQRLAAAWPAGAQAFDMLGRPQALASLRLSQAPTYVLTPLDRLDALCAAIETARPAPAQPVLAQAVYVAAVDQIAARLVNQSAAPVEAILSTLGARIRAKLPVGAAPQRVALKIPGGLLARNGRQMKVRVEADGRAVWSKLLRIDLRPCRPAAGVRVDGSLSEWGEPDARLDQRGLILPPDPNIGWSGPADLSVTAWWAWDAENFYFAARVRDDKHCAPYAGAGNFWQSDSLQVAFDPLNDAAESSEFNQDDVELGCVLGAKGPAAFVTQPGGERASFPCAIRREGAATVYEIAVPWKQLHLRPAQGEVLSFNFIVNDNDGQGRAYWMGLRPGIGEGKRPFAYMDLYLK